MIARVSVIWPVWQSVTGNLPGEPWLQMLTGLLVWLVITAGTYGLMCLWGRRPVRYWAWASRRALLGHWLAGDMDFRAVAGVSVVVLTLADLAMPGILLITPLLFICPGALTGGVVMMLFNTGRGQNGRPGCVARALLAGLISLQSVVLMLTGWMVWSGVSGLA